MIANLVAELLRGLLVAAVHEQATCEVVNDACGPARFVVLDPESQVVFGAFVASGESVRVNRSFRLIVEPLDHVRIRPLCCVSRTWSTT